MPDYNVNPNGALDTSDELRLMTVALRNALDALGGAAATFQSRSDGDAILSYMSAQAKWNQGLTQMEQSLGASGSTLTEIVHRYQLTDRRGSALFNGQV